MPTVASGTGRIRVVGIDNYNNEKVFIVAWKKNTYTSKGGIASIQTQVRCKTEKEDVTVTLPEPIWYFSCAIEYPYMTYIYSNGSMVIGDVTKTTLVVIDIKTGAKGTFSNEGLLMRTKKEDGGYEWDKTFEGHERWKMLTAVGIIKT